MAASEVVRYGLTRKDMQEARWRRDLVAAFCDLAQSWHYAMQQLALTYRTRKVMYGPPRRSPDWLLSDLLRVPQGLPQGHEGTQG